MAQSTIEGGRTKGSRDHRNFFQVTESPKPKGRKWDQAPPRSAPEHRKSSQLKIDQHRLDEGQGGWFGEYRRHSEAARQGQDHRERHLPVNVKPQERPEDVHEPHIIGTRGSRDRIFIIGITADGIDIGMDRPIDNMGEALKEAQASAKAPNMMSYPGQVRGHVGAIYAQNYSEARTKLWAYAKRMKWVPPPDEDEERGIGQIKNGRTRRQPHDQEQTQHKSELAHGTQEEVPGVHRCRPERETPRRIA